MAFVQALFNRGEGKREAGSTSAQGRGQHARLMATLQPRSGSGIRQPLADCYLSPDPRRKLGAWAHQIISHDKLSVISAA